MAHTHQSTYTPYSICPQCRSLTTAGRPCGCRPRLVRDVPVLPAWVVWAVLLGLGWGLLAGLYVGCRALARGLAGGGW